MATSRPMRVVAGRLGGRRLTSPPGRDTRPTSERVREATFNALGSLDAIDGATVVDLYAGSGAMGIEALSRGAARVTFVERDRAAVAAIRQNIDDLDLAADTVVRAADVGSFLASFAGSPPGSASGPTTAPTTAPAFDLAIVDPPYAFDDWAGLLAALPAQMAVLESGRPVEPGEGWSVLRARAYGGTVVTIVLRDRALETP